MNQNSTSNLNSSIIDVTNNDETHLPQINHKEFENLSTNQQWKLGQKFAKKLSLNSTQIELLDKVSFSDNLFNEIDFCKVQILKEFLRTIDFLNEKCIPVNKAYATVVEEISEIIIYIKYNYRKESLNYQYTLDAIKTEIYNHILKYCENNVREVYAIKRKIGVDFSYQHPDISKQYEKKIVAKLSEFLVTDRNKILDADYKTNSILNENNTNRWKLKFDDITTHFSTIISFNWEVERLVEINEKNPSVSHIYFEAAKLLAEKDKISSLEMYFKYLDKDLVSTKFENKQFPKAQQKMLFSKKEELDNFSILVSQFVFNRNLDEALAQLSTIYQPKRKKISLDRNAIQDIQTQHSQTVNLLEEYLNDDEIVPPKPIEIVEEIVIPPIVVPPISSRKFIADFHFSDVQKDILEWFEKSSFTIPRTELEDFSRNQNLFLNSTIEAINDTCYEVLDDVLIEEDDEYYNIYPDYYKKLLLND